MKHLTIIYHSVTGASRQMAQAVALGAQGEPDCQVTCLSAPQANPADLLNADGLVWVCPEMLGSMSGLMKDFFERCYYPVLDKITGRAYALIVCAGSDGQGAVRQIQRIATGWRLNAVGQPVVVCTHAQTPDRIAQAKVIDETNLKHGRELGAAMAAGLVMGIY
ncbi:NAD(P)H-dependent oxidoreductase [Limnobacter humi]|uniref:NAD(P)H-dependent oxidoreductase n=1 Tax=Limnobacter humi TaxID=1778671 RepID=A0ABT1WHM7_9BURK|nr:NAD(P)H-dependent oxidoreductase [Limnobacter humi]MCQ8897030.1 NAD(P)H-dependent oxidoreductase [Limnobacter humi]